MAAPPAEEGASAPPSPRGRPWVLHIGLFLLTGITTTLAGVRFANEIPPDIGGEGFVAEILAGLLFYRELLFAMEEPARLLSGFTFSVPLLAVFLCHEMGHFLAARHYRVDASLPYFIPVPFALGTLGAVIAMRAPSKDRGALLDIGAAGPLVGFVVAFVVLLIGFALSDVKTAAEIAQIADGKAVIIEGDSAVYALARWMIFGTLPPGDDVWIHPTAWAGWFGMFLTWLNLQPFSQFDGGHIAYALVGRHARAITFVVFGYLAILAAITLNPNWVALALIMVVLSRFIGLSHPPIDDPRPLRPRHKLIAFVSTLVFLGTFVYNPLRAHPAAEAAMSDAAATADPAREGRGRDDAPAPHLRTERVRPSATDEADSPLPQRRDPRARRPDDPRDDRAGRELP